MVKQKGIEVKIKKRAVFYCNEENQIKMKYYSSSSSSMALACCGGACLRFICCTTKIKINIWNSE